MNRWNLVLAFLTTTLTLPGSQGATDPTRVQALYDGEQWGEVVAATEAAHRSADAQYLRGMALVKLGRIEHAKQEFERGRSRWIRDSRFPTELAGLAYLSKDFSTARRHLHKAHQLAPADAYTNEFLAMLYLLEGNVEAALKYWNDVDKPLVRDVHLDPSLAVNPNLLRRALAFSDRGVLLREEWVQSIANLDRLNLFSSWRLDLLPVQKGEFNVNLQALERGGISNRGLARVLPLLRGLPYQAVHFDIINFRGTGASLTSLWRWDAQKRRIYSVFSGPVRDDPRLRYRILFDGRKENWDVSRTYRAGPLAGDFHMDRVEAAAELEAGLTGRLTWTNAGSVSRREFSGFVPDGSSLFTSGNLLQQRSTLTYQLLRIPENRFVVEVSGSEAAGRHFAASRFAKLQGSVAARWLPQTRGDDLVVETRLRSGKAFGSVPFDELFILGMERDNDLWLRGRAGTRHGKKGNAPLGRSFLLWQSGARRTIYRSPFLRVQVGPFLDSGRAEDSNGNFGTSEWMFDAGLEARMRLAGGVTVLLTYGRDLRSGRGAFYTDVNR